LLESFSVAFTTSAIENSCESLRWIPGITAGNYLRSANEFPENLPPKHDCDPPPYRLHSALLWLTSLPLGVVRISWGDGHVLSRNSVVCKLCCVQWGRVIISPLVMAHWSRG
jgi:hypothetical protein